MTTLEALVRQLRAPDQAGCGRVQEVAYGQPNLGRLMDLDASAEAVCAWGHTAIPGLLQTSTYGRAVVRTIHPRLPRVEVYERVLLKQQRAEAFWGLIRDRRITAHFVLGEQALEYVLQRDAHREQMRHILALSELPGVEIQVYPVHQLPPAAATHFSGWTLAEASMGESVLKRVVYTETALGGFYSTRLQDVAAVYSAFEDLVGMGFTLEGSKRLLRRKGV